jgi:hypothetical protein
MKQRYIIILALSACLAVPGAAYGQGRLLFKAKLRGAQQVTEVVTDTTAKVIADFNKGLTKVIVTLTVVNGVAVTGAHFHCARAGEDGPVAFGLFSPGPLVFDAASGVAEGALTNDDFTGSDCVSNIGRPVNNIAALAFAMRDGLIYTNVHTSANGSGEVRGQLQEIR